jgi:hypothetical protein
LTLTAETDTESLSVEKGEDEENQGAILRSLLRGLRIFYLEAGDDTTGKSC